MKPIVELVNVSKTFKRDIFTPAFQALNDITCSFAEGVATAVIGHNGAGKTTTLRLILGLLNPDQGQVLYQGHTMTAEDRRRIGYMPETNKLPGELRVHELLSLQLSLYKPSLKTQNRHGLIDKKLSEIGLHKFAKTRVDALSKGLGRRLAWALASIHDPKLLILDEPLSGLDPLGRHEFCHWLETYIHNGCSVLMSTHDLESARKLCSQFVIFRQAKIVHQGPPPSEDRLLSFFSGVI